MSLAKPKRPGDRAQRGDTKKKPQSESVKYIHDELKHSVETFLYDVCDKGNIPLSIIQYTLWYVKQIKTQLKIAQKKFKDTEIVIYALYESLNRHNLPRTPQELQVYSGILPARLWSIENCLQLKTTPCRAIDMIERYCVILNLDFSDIVTMKGIIKNMFGLGHIHPQCLISVVIYLYCKEAKKDISVRKICQTCGVSTSNMYKILQKITPRFKAKISLLYTP